MTLHTMAIIALRFTIIFYTIVFASAMTIKYAVASRVVLFITDNTMRQTEQLRTTKRSRQKLII